MSRPRTPARSVRTILWIILPLVAVNFAFSVWAALTEPRWQARAMLVDGVILLVGGALSLRAFRRGAPEQALTRIYTAIFASILLSLPLIRGSHTLVAFGLVAFVLATAPSVLPLHRVNRWAQGAVALGIVSSAFDVIALPTQVVYDQTDGFGVLVGLGVGLFIVLGLRGFRRYPLETKLTIGFLVVAMLPLLAVGALRPLTATESPAASHAVGLAGAAIAATLAFVVGRTVAAPLAAVAAAMERFTGGDLEARTRVRGQDEIGVLAARFNVLAGDVAGLVRSLRDEIKARSAREVELRGVNEALTAARDEATAANRSKSTFLAHMSHELRTPLNAIIGYGEMIAEETAEPTVRDDAARILTAARHLLGIISDILDLSKIEAGKLEMEVEDFDLIHLVRGTCESSRPLFDGRGNTLHVACARDRLRLRGDARKVRQVLLNLLGNAAKFTDHARVWCEVRTVQSDGEVDDDAPSAVEISVRDEGIGIPEDRLATLFEPFTQVDSSFARAYEGTGLGLTISRLFVEKMGGSITVQSLLGAGSTFTVRLPLGAEA
ncbi:MAG: ATP-binding protein [Nannocystaceae bacterium]